MRWTISIVFTASLKLKDGWVPVRIASMNSRFLAWKPPYTKNSSLRATSVVCTVRPTVSPSAYRVEVPSGSPLRRCRERAISIENVRRPLVQLAINTPMAPVLNGLWRNHIDVRHLTACDRRIDRFRLPAAYPAQGVNRVGAVVQHVVNRAGEGRDLVLVEGTTACEIGRARGSIAHLHRDRGRASLKSNLRDTAVFAARVASI